ncbi:hypothetical protein ACKTEK_14785 [Tepidamorphus sp. 3E244]|uniref:hypothetical protein n=1 Tax=Tepidamorphus sp. 3E244 TaxID=3385498 RepID=UPI0038FC828C
MPSEAHLDHAVREGIISEDQRERILALARTDLGGQAAYASPDEPFRLFRGFRDFFLAIGILILALGLGSTMLSVLPWDSVEMNSGRSLLGAAAFAILAGVGWGFGELVTRKLRMPLASIIVVLSFCGSVAISAAFLGAAFLGGSGDIAKSVIPVIAAAASILAAVAFYLRFRLPFVLLPLGGSAVATALTLAHVFDPEIAPTHLAIVAGICGLFVFAAAMRYDLSDPNRLTRHSECAFWLHLLAAPLIVHSIFSFLSADLYAGAPYAAVIVIAIIAVLAFIALLIDRRAMLVSGLTYLGWAIGVSLSVLLGSASGPMTFLVLGLLLVGLAIGWSSVRRVILNALPRNELIARLPPATHES